VAMLRAFYAHLWPSNTSVKGSRSPARPWPSCWAQHPGLVADLRMLKSWADALAGGEVKGDAHAASADWRRYVHTLLVDDLRAISGRTCRHGHVDPSQEPPARGPEVRGAPPLPGQPHAAFSDPPPDLHP
jgi:hypothetical protein